MVELDLHRSRDGHLVVMHDGRVDATTDGQGEVAALTLAELRRLDAGRGERIPTFEEVLELPREGCGLYVELKGAGTAEPAVEAIRRRGLAAAVIVGSFQPALIADARARRRRSRPRCSSERPRRPGRRGDGFQRGLRPSVLGAAIREPGRRRDPGAPRGVPGGGAGSHPLARGAAGGHRAAPRSAGGRGLRQPPELLRVLKAAAAPGSGAMRPPTP